MHVSPDPTTENWLLQEKVVYSFQRAPSPIERHSGHPQPPDIILLCLWSQASKYQVEHYITGYRELFPGSQIILSNTTSFPNLSNDKEDYECVLGKLVDASSRTQLCCTTRKEHRAPRSRPSVLLHLFGTCGAANACHLLRGFRMRMGGPLNVGAVIADSEPSACWTTSLTSSRPLSSTVLSMFLAFWLRLQECMLFWPYEGHVGQIHHDLNNDDLLPRKARKCFVFAQRGLMLTWLLPSSFEADEQSERREHAFRRSSIDHKRRWTGDQERYWAGIENLWEGR